MKGKGCLVQGVGAAKVPLDIQATGILPAIILEGEEASLGANLLNDLLHSNLLLSLAGNGLAVTSTSARPSDLSDVLALGSSAGADLGGLLELLSSEVTSLLSRDRCGEVGVHLDSEDINVVAEGGTLLFPGADGFGGSDGDVRREISAAELLTNVVDVGGKLGGCAVVVEHALVTNNDHGDAVLGCVGLDVLKLVIGIAREGSPAAAATTLEEDAVDDLQSVALALRNNVLEDTAVGAVGTDGGEAEFSDFLDIILDVFRGLALAIVGVGSIGDGPLVVLDDDAATGAVAASWFWLLSCLGAHGSGLGGVGGLRRVGLRSVGWRRL